MLCAVASTEFPSGVGCAVRLTERALHLIFPLGFYEEWHRVGSCILVERLVHGASWWITYKNKASAVSYRVAWWWLGSLNAKQSVIPPFFLATASCLKCLVNLEHFHWKDIGITRL